MISTSRNIGVLSCGKRMVNEPMVTYEIEKSKYKKNGHMGCHCRTTNLVNSTVSDICSSYKIQNSKFLLKNTGFKVTIYSEKTF